MDNRFQNLRKIRQTVSVESITIKNLEVLKLKLHKFLAHKQLVMRANL